MSFKKVSGVYKITNIVNNKVYVGSAVSIYDRWSLHKHQLKLNKHHCKHLQRSYNKHGLDAFKFEILETCNVEFIIEKEQFYINSIKPEYNINPIAGSRLGAKHTEESKQKNRENNSGVNGYWYGKIGPSKGRIQTDEEKEKRRESGLKVHSDPIFKAKHKESCSNAQNDPIVKAKQKERMKLWWAERKKAQVNNI